MKTTIFTAVAALAAGAAHADLTIDVVGTPGSGVTTWTFGTNAPGSAELNGSIRTNAGDSFNGADTGQFPFGEDTVLNTLYQDQVFALTGNATITMGNVTESITGIFIDDDGGSADDMGIRVANQLDFLQNDASSWTGSGTVNVDINDFALGVWSINDIDGQRLFIADPITVTFRVPAPGSAALLGLAGFATARRRR